MTSRVQAVPGHVGVIMDGNGRWAQRRDMARTEGHRVGEERLADTVRAASDLGIGWLTVYGFSTENWKRPKFEVDFILGLHKNIFGRREEMHANNVRIRWIGRTPDRGSRVPKLIHREIRKAVEQTKDNTGLTFTVAFDYGSREELVQAARRVVASGIAPEQVTARDVQAGLYDPAMPPVDLLIRTSGEHRLSNFLLWQAPGAHFHVTDKFWPEFGRPDLEAAVADWRAAVAGADR